MQRQPRVMIVGAGLSGLATAYRLRQLRPDLELTILERGPHLGGNIRTETEAGFTVELGPNGFLDSKPGTVALCRDLGLEAELIPASDGARKNRFLSLGAGLQALPGSPIALLRSKLLSPYGKLQFLLEPFRHRNTRRADESIASFARRRIGSEAAGIFADALVTGIHGGDWELLSIRSAFPRLYELEQRFGSVIRGVFASAKAKRRAAQARGEPKPGPPCMWSFRGGLQRLIDALGASGLRERTVFNTRPRRLERTPTGRPALTVDGATHTADAIVLTQPAYAQAELLAEIAPQLADEIAAIPYNAIVVVALGYRAGEAPMNLDGFGFLVPQRLRRDILGVQWCSSIFPERAPAGAVLMRVLCGGWQRREMVEWDDERLVRAVREELRRMQGITAEPIYRRIIRWPRAIPQYLLGHGERVARIMRLAATLPGVFLGGNAYYGVAMNDCTEQGEILARRVADFLMAERRPSVLP